MGCAVDKHTYRNIGNKQNQCGGKPGKPKRWKRNHDAILMNNHRHWAGIEQLENDTFLIIVNCNMSSYLHSFLLLLLYSNKSHEILSRSYLNAAMYFE